MKTLEQLLAERKELTQRLRDINDKILIVEDGYFYICYTSEWGMHSMQLFNNRVACRDYAKYYCGDNGFCHVFTNNKAMLEDGLIDLEIVNSFEELEKTWVYEEIKQNKSWLPIYTNYKNNFNK